MKKYADVECTIGYSITYLINDYKDGEFKSYKIATIDKNILKDKILNKHFHLVPIRKLTTKYNPMACNFWPFDHITYWIDGYDPVNHVPLLVGLFDMRLKIKDIPTITQEFS